jgi:AP-2 complex subunit alpha
MAMRGLTVFISDLRNCSTKEQEEKRVEKEMAHIRSKFTSDTNMNGYNRKKYVWKILYMYMLGYEVDFGHMEAVNLISSQRYSEKSVGYAWCALMLREGDELLRLIINSIRVDLISRNDNAVCLVRVRLACVGGVSQPVQPEECRAGRAPTCRPCPCATQPAALALPRRRSTRFATLAAKSLPRRSAQTC